MDNQKLQENAQMHFTGYLPDLQEMNKNVDKVPVLE